MPIIDQSDIQALETFRLPKNFRGRSSIFVQFWWFVQAIFFSHSPQFAYGFRRWLLRCFGCHVGIGVIIRPSVKITYPWKVRIGDYSWIRDDVFLYSLGEIEIARNTVISHKSFLCTGDHDYGQSNFPIRARKIVVEEGCWIAADVFIAPGVTIRHGAVIGARSSVFKDMPDNMVCMGSPCKPIKRRSASNGKYSNLMEADIVEA